MVVDYRNKKITVVGLARSGLSAAHLLADLGAKVFVSEKSDNDNLRALASGLRKRRIEVELGGHTESFIKEKDLIVASPGVSNRAYPLIRADELKIPVISEIELAWSLCPATVIAVTGTNGKTTVTTLIAKILEAKGKRAFALGNIGKPFSGEVRNMNCADFVSLEVSSFQLERIINFKPKVSVILNISLDHLDRYKDMDEYLAAKKRIYMNQEKDDYSVLNYDDQVIRALSKETKAKTVFFSSKDSSGDSGFNLNPNHFAVMAVGSIFGISKDACLEVFRNFKGVEHRLEEVRRLDGIKFINDSKATNVDSTVWALNNISEPVILIAGGRDKNSDYRTISNLLKEKVKFLILIGEAADKINNSFKGLLPIKRASSLDEAVNLAFGKAASGDCVLLSPMCASFDMFDNYEHRGKIFKEIVDRLIRG